MGGMGSGRYAAGYVKGKQRVESMKSIRISWFTKYLREQKTAGFSVYPKNKPDEKLWKVIIEPIKLCMYLEREGHTEQVFLETTPCHYGGKRYWFICKDCGNRCGRLFDGDNGLACRKCYDLNYYSQQHTKTDCHYYNQKAELIAYKLDDEYEMDYARPRFPSRPKNMRWTTYMKLKQEFDYYTDKAYRVWLRGAMNILSR